VTAFSTVNVSLDDRSYDVVIGPGLIGETGQRLKALIGLNPVVVVTDDNVAALHLAKLCNSLDDAGIPHHEIILPAGERTKEFGQLQNLMESVLDLKPDRGWSLLALGGGVIGDIVGVAASLILRGIGFIQAPTTLLAQVDSSVGGKTAINTRHGKNLVGSFYQPRLVLADTEVLDTLDRRELLAGYGEVVKYGLLGDREFFGWLTQNGPAIINGDPDARRHAVMTSCAAKAEIVAQDEREQGRRALLNLGHTFGHALEAETGYGQALLHGEAVAIGSLLAFELSANLGLCSHDDVATVRRHFETIGLPTKISNISAPINDAGALLSHMRLDKKVKDGMLRFILVRGIGDAFIADNINEGKVVELLETVIAA
jgi:3-dehydroquinate synthase